MHPASPRFASNALAFFISCTLLIGCASGGSQLAPAQPMTRNAFSSALSAGDVDERETTLAGTAGPNLYVANTGNNTVTVYRRGNITLQRTISQGINGPIALAFGRSGELFVANDQANTVTVYASGSTSVLRTISGLDYPDALAVGNSGNLYVANGNANTVTLYGPGGRSPLRTISQGIDSPQHLAIAASGNLFVANVNSHTVTVYRRGSTTSLRTLAGRVRSDGSGVRRQQ